VLTHLTKFKEK